MPTGRGDTQRVTTRKQRESEGHIGDLTEWSDDLVRAFEQAFLERMLGGPDGPRERFTTECRRELLASVVGVLLQDGLTSDELMYALSNSALAAVVEPPASGDVISFFHGVLSGASFNRRTAAPQSDETTREADNLRPRLATIDEAIQTELDTLRNVVLKGDDLSPLFQCDATLLYLQNSQGNLELRFSSPGVVPEVLARHAQSPLLAAATIAFQDRKGISWDPERDERLPESRQHLRRFGVGSIMAVRLDDWENYGIGVMLAYSHGTLQMRAAIEESVAFMALSKQCVNITAHLLLRQIASVTIADLVGLPAAEVQIEWTQEKADRRCELIDKQIQRTISSHEQIELERLTEELCAHVDTEENVPLAGARRLHARLLKMTRVRQSDD